MRMLVCVRMLAYYLFDNLDHKRLVAIRQVDNVRSVVQIHGRLQRAFYSVQRAHGTGIMLSEHVGVYLSGFHVIVTE